MSASLLTNQGGTAVNASATTYYSPISGNVSNNSTEAQVQKTFRVAGTLSNLYVRVSVNGVTASSTFRSRVNGANGAQSFTIASSTTGEFEDTSNSDSISAGDEFNFQIVVGGSGTSITLMTRSVLFTPSSNTISMQGSATSTSLSTNSVTTYTHAGGGNVLDSTANNSKVQVNTAGTLKNLYLYVSANARTTDTIFGSAVNTVNGAISVTVGSTATGVFEDTSNTDSVSANDYIQFRITTSTGGNTITWQQIGIDLETTNNSFILNAGFATGLTYNSALSRYIQISGNAGANTNETTTQGQINIARTASNVWCRVSANSLDGSTVLSLRQNAGSSGVSTTIGSGATGEFEDTSNSIALNATDEINYLMDTTGSGSGSLTLRSLSTLFTLASGSSASLSPSASVSLSISLSPSLSPSSSISPSSSVSLSPSPSPSSSVSLSISASPSLSVSLSPSASQSPSSSVSLSVSLSPSLSPSTTPSLSPSLSPSVSVSLSQSATVSASPSLSVSLSPSLSPSLSLSLSPSLSASVSSSGSPSPTTSASPSMTQSSSPSLSPSPSQEPGSGLFSRETGISLPLTKDNLDIIYGYQDEIDVSEDDGVYVDQPATISGYYMMHQYRFVNNTNKDKLCMKVNLHSTIAGSVSPIYLQIWNVNTSSWETLVVNNTVAQDVDVDLQYCVESNVSNYYDSDYEVAIRVYQLNNE